MTEAIERTEPSARSVPGGQVLGFTRLVMAIDITGLVIVAYPPSGG